MLLARTGPQAAGRCCTQQGQATLPGPASRAAQAGVLTGRLAGQRERALDGAAAVVPAHDCGRGGGLASSTRAVGAPACCCGHSRPCPCAAGGRNTAHSRPARTDVLDLEHRHRVLHAAHDLRVGGSRRAWATRSVWATAAAKLQARAGSPCDAAKQRPAAAQVHLLGRGQVCRSSAPCRPLHPAHRNKQTASTTSAWARRTFMSLCVARLPTLRCTNTSPGPSPSSSLAGTRESEQPILRKTGAGGVGAAASPARRWGSCSCKNWANRRHA